MRNPQIPKSSEDMNEFSKLRLDKAFHLKLFGLVAAFQNPPFCLRQFPLPPISGVGGARGPWGVVHPNLSPRRHAFLPFALMFEACGASGCGFPLPPFPGKAV